MKKYTPAPGTIPAIVYEWLLTMEAGASVTSADIAKYLGIPRQRIPTAMEYATDREFFKRRNDGKLIHWSIPEAAPEPEPEPVYVGEITPSRVYVNASQREPLKASWGQIRAGAQVAFGLPSGGSSAELRELLRP